MTMPTDPVGTETPRPFDPFCNRYADQIPSVVYEARLVDLSPEQWVFQEEGTFNIHNLHFACDECYIKLGTPSAPGPGWKAP